MAGQTGPLGWAKSDGLKMMSEPQLTLKVVRGFTVWQEDCPGDPSDWERASVTSYSSRDATSVRFVWNHRRDHETRVLIEIFESESRERAGERLQEILRSDQSTGIIPGQVPNYDSSFFHPPGIPPAAFGHAANVSLTVSSFGRNDASEIVEWFRQLGMRLADLPAQALPGLELRAAVETLKPGDTTDIFYSLPWRLGPSGYFKFFGDNGTLFFGRGQLRFTARGSGGLATIAAFAVDEGRQPYTARIALRIED
jgi:hypothetical protein